MSETTLGNDGLVFTDAAARKVGELIREEGNPNLKLRVFVSGGGCSGFQYGFTFDEKIEEGDAEFPNQGVTLLVDYAHTGDALENVLSTLKELAGARIITVFGCGGDRDPGKRPIMGRTAARMSDLSIVTSDNPRTEDPLVILAQVREGITPTGIREYTQEELTNGFSDKGFVMLENRHAAIRLAIGLARPGDIVLLAGKGHEDYQIIGRTKHHFDDREEAAQAFAELDG